ncbi:MAG: AMP-binding enzyme, partial [Geminicoccaceae bacterium]
YIDGRGYVHISGRGKDLIISGGFNVYPAEVEGAIEALPGVGECAVIGVPHPDLGEAVVAVVVPKPGALLDEQQVIAALAGDLAKYKLPKRIYLRDELPRNAMGKVQKNQLRQQHEHTFALEV